MICNPEVFSFVSRCAASCETPNQIEVMMNWAENLYIYGCRLTQFEFKEIIKLLETRLRKYKEKKYGTNF